MFIPIGTDAPIRHLPIVTGIFIFLNIICFILQHGVVDEFDWAGNRQPVAAGVMSTIPVQGFNQRGDEDFNPGQWRLDDLLAEELTEEEERELAKAIFDERKNQGWRAFSLWIGEGLHPIQWVTSFFMHADPVHLIGNLIFLALFGLVVESRMGNIQFAIYYLAIGTLGSMVTQTLLLGAQENFALGASGAIYGLMVTAMLWSPKFNIICIVIIWLRVYFPRVPILIFGVIYVLIDIGSVLFGAELVNTPLLHVIGAGVGCVAALVVLNQRWVDTEYEDVVSLAMEAAGKDPKKRERTRKLTKKEREERERAAVEKQLTKQRRLDHIWKSVDAHLAANNLDAAIMMERQVRQLDSKAGWDEPRLLKLIGKLQTQKQWDNVVQFSQLYLKRYESRSKTIRFNLAKVLLLQKHRPRKALEAIQPLESTQLTNEEAKMMRQIIAKAKQMIDEGTLEFGD